MSETMWVTKYALSGGIAKKEGDRSRSDSEYFRVEGEYNLYRIGRDCFQTRAAAEVRAEAMRKDRIESLKKQIAKLEKLSFTGTPQ